MNRSLNTFTVILLAFPFFLAQRGRLAAYVALAKPSGTSSTSQPKPAQATASAGTSPPAASGSSSGMTQALAALPEFTALFS